MPIFPVIPRDEKYFDLDPEISFRGGWQSSSSADARGASAIRSPVRIALSWC